MLVRFATSDKKSFSAKDGAVLVLNALWLVTDRTKADVDARNEKGTYGAVDLNRVNEVIAYLTSELARHGYFVDTAPKTDWTESDIPYPALMERYLQDIAALRNKLKLVETTPEAPTSAEKLTHIEANEIEIILEALDLHIRNMTSIVDAGWTAGLAYTGFYAKEAY